MSQKATSYAHPEVLVDIDWVQNNINNPKVRIAEVDYDPSSNYLQGHIPNSVLFDWRKDMNDPVTRDILSKEALEQLLSRVGYTPEMTLVLYGDFNNWFAAFAFWIFKYYRVENIRL
ncbi:MAG: rhodanese-like domain-containing protein, partial [Conexivisphaerales archaeon]